MDKEAELLKLRCAIWLQSCSRTHAIWCNCGVWTSHIKGWRPTEGDGPSVVADVGDGAEVRIDEFGNLVDPNANPGDDDG